MMTVVTGMASEPGQGTETDKKVLTVGLFRYVPDIKAFETALTAQWKNRKVMFLSSMAFMRRNI